MKPLVRQIVIGGVNDPLMVLYKFPKPNVNFSAAYDELMYRITTKADASATWGYFPAYEPDGQKNYPACFALVSSLQKEFIDLLGSPLSGSHLAFVRAASKTPVSEFGGLHIDVDIGVGHTRPAGVSLSTNILRILINPYKYARVLRYVDCTVEELVKKGVSISREKYAMLSLPPGFDLKSIEVPPMANDGLWVLAFWSDLVPHAGITDDNGHFLLAYGSWAEKLKNPLR